MVLVVGKGFSRFVSYADLPPILVVEAPNTADVIRWRKRWQKNTRQASQQFEQAVSASQTVGLGDKLEN